MDDKGAVAPRCGSSGPDLAKEVGSWNSGNSRGLRRAKLTSVYRPQLNIPRDGSLGGTHSLLALFLVLKKILFI